MDAEAVQHAIAFEIASESFRNLLRDIWVSKGAVEDEVVYPAEIVPYMQAQPQNFPSCEVTSGQGVLNNPDSRVIDLTYNVEVFWHVNGADEGEVNRTLLRFVRATQDYFKDLVSINSIAAAVWLGNEDKSPLVPWREPENPYLQSAVQELYVRVIR